MAPNAPRLGQRGAQSKPSGSAAVVPQGQGVVNASKGGPPPVNLRLSAVGGDGETTLNSQPAKK